MIEVALWAATGVLALALLLGLIRVITAPDAASRAAVADLIFFAAVAIMIVQGALHRSAVSVDLAMLAAILGIVTTIALARILTRGQR